MRQNTFVLMCRRQYKDTALHYAAKSGQLPVAVYIVEQADDEQINALNDVRLIDYTRYNSASTVSSM